MRKRPLYISFGMPKSGSTLAFQLTRTLLELAGADQSKIGEGIVDAKTKINYVHKLDGPSLKALMDEARKLPGPLAIKTHSRVFPKVESAFKRGAVFGHAVCRDPRDVALPMLDAAKDGRDWGSNQDGSFQTVADTLERVRSGIGIFKKWVALPNVMPIHYERVAFGGGRGAARHRGGHSAGHRNRDRPRVHAAQPREITALENRDGSGGCENDEARVQGIHRDVVLGHSISTEAAETGGGFSGEVASAQGIDQKSR